MKKRLIMLLVTLGLMVFLVPTALAETVLQSRIDADMAKAQEKESKASIDLNRDLKNKLKAEKKETKVDKKQIEKDFKDRVKLQGLDIKIDFNQNDYKVSTETSLN